MAMVYKAESKVGTPDERPPPLPLTPSEGLDAFEDTAVVIVVMVVYVYKNMHGYKYRSII
jgi:hypothetical protein